MGESPRSDGSEGGSERGTCLRGIACPGAEVLFNESFRSGLSDLSDLSGRKDMSWDDADVELERGDL